MRVQTIVVAAVIATMATGVAFSADQPKRSVLRLSNNAPTVRSIVRPVGFDEDPPEPPIHQPPQVNSYSAIGARKMLTVQQQPPRQMLPRRGQQLFAQPVAQRVNHLEDTDDGGLAAQPACACTAAAPAAGCCGAPCGGHQGGCGAAPCCGSPCSASPCCASPCCAAPCCAPACCAAPCCEPCCSSSCCGGGMANLFGGHGCGHRGGHGCCGGCEVSCGCAHQHCGCAHQHCGCGSCCQPCCAPDIFACLNKLFGSCCRCRSACHCGGCGCGGCAMNYGCASCGCAMNYGCAGGGCSNCGNYGGGCNGGAPGAMDAAPAPMPSNGSPSDVPPPPKVR